MRDDDDAPAPDGHDEPELEFSGELWYWRGPSPYHFVTVPAPESLRLRAVSTAVTYGWGMIPVVAGVGGTRWRTSLFPKDGGYVVPVKDAVRQAEALEPGDTLVVRLAVAPGG